MDLAARKYKFIEQFMKIASVEKLEKLEIFLRRELETTINPFDELPNVAKQLLAKSKKDSANDRVRSHADVMADIKAKYNLS